MTHALPEKPEVLAIAGKAGMGRFEVVGRLFTMWRWFDLHTTEGNALGVTKVTLSECLFGYSSDTKFVDAVISEGWLIEDAQGIQVKNFDAHISESAKTRAQTAKRVAKSKASSANAKGNGDSVTESLPNALPKEEKRRVLKTLAQTSAFEEFWKAYPKRKSRGQAETAFSKINPDEQLLAVMVAAIEQAKTQDDWRKEGGKFIPYPATWLNAKGWQDESPQVSVVKRVAI